MPLSCRTGKRMRTQTRHTSELALRHACIANITPGIILGTSRPSTLQGPPLPPSLSISYYQFFFGQTDWISYVRQDVSSTINRSIVRLAFTEKSSEREKQLNSQPLQRFPLSVSIAAVTTVKGAVRAAFSRGELGVESGKLSLQLYKAPSF